MRDRTRLFGSSRGMNSSLLTYQITGLSLSSVEASNSGAAAYIAAGKHALTAVNSESASVQVYWHGATRYTAQATAGTRTVKFSFTVTAVIHG